MDKLEVTAECTLRKSSKGKHYKPTWDKTPLKLHHFSRKGRFSNGMLELTIVVEQY